MVPRDAMLHVTGSPDVATLTSMPPRRRKRTAPDDLPPAELARHVEALHGVPARFVEAVEVKETHGESVVWEGAVKVYAIKKHPSGATRVYAWTAPTDSGRRRVFAVLGVDPVTSPAMAVRTAILAQVREAERAQAN